MICKLERCVLARKFILPLSGIKVKRSSVVLSEELLNHLAIFISTVGRVGQSGSKMRGNPLAICNL
jgi:hypothetical protein